VIAKRFGEVMALHAHPGITFERHLELIAQFLIERQSLKTESIDQRMMAAKRCCLGGGTLHQFPAQPVAALIFMHPQIVNVKPFALLAGNQSALHDTAVIMKIDRQVRPLTEVDKLLVVTP